MNIFELHKEIISDYKSYISSFINIDDERIKNIVDKETKRGILCPEPLIQFNPSFKYDLSLSELCREENLHHDLNKIFKGFQLYKHQVDALRLGCNGKDFVVTSGTGSGKSLTYIGTIFNSILKNNKEGIKAIIVYPMNALINSQTGELEKFRDNYGKNFPITFAQYTGQEDSTARDEIREKAPDILLTNYMMLELIMTRANELDRSIRKSIKNSLQFLVFDEMHTYKGRQGSDVAFLIRRIKAYAKNKIQSIGTSATMSSGIGTDEEQKSEVAQTASKLFGSLFESKQIISESLTRVTDYSGSLPSQLELRDCLIQDINVNWEEDKLKNYPLSIWLENRIGIIEKEGLIKRRSPLSLNEIIDILQGDSGESKTICKNQINRLLEWSSKINGELFDAGSRRAYFPFRMHQFISQTGSVFVTLENKSERKIQLNPGYFIKNKNDEKQRIYPVVFSRITGKEFICVKKNYTTNILEPRSFGDAYDEDDSTQAGYIIIQNKNEPSLWDETMTENLPDSWFRVLKNGNIKVNKNYANRLPSRIFFNSYGKFSDSQSLIDSDDAITAWFMPAKLIFDPTCFVFYDLKSSEASKLMTLGNEGRSTATTVLSLSSIKQLRKSGLGHNYQKLLSFTDNRQDASLQSGHFNDFINIGLIRSAIYNGLKNANDNQLTIENIGEKVMETLSLNQIKYALVPGKFSGAKKDNEDALIDYLTIRILQDLKRAWRYTMPNLEQCALLKISYKYLLEEISNDDAWSDIPFLNEFDEKERLDFVETTLDYFRTSNGINHRFFFSERKSIESKIKNKLKAEWGFSEGESIPFPNYMRYESIGRIKQRGTFTKSIGKQSSWGKYCSDLFSNESKLTQEEYIEFCKKYFKRLEELGLLTSEELKGEKGDTVGYLLNSNSILWELGDFNTVKHDKVRIRTRNKILQKPNLYFQTYYRQFTDELKSIRSAEHTSQIKNEDRKERESAFREGLLSVLFCSPTMELGIDISNLNVVHMRNVPPSPSNYAQRSGRAGRSGQGALVITYCSQYSPHDRNYFSNKLQMVSGIVNPPRLSLENRELIKSHINAMYLLETGISIGSSITDILDVGDQKKLPIKSNILAKIYDGHTLRKNIILDYINRMLDQDGNLKNYLDIESAEIIIDESRKEFEDAFNRWRRLYKNALKMIEESRAIIDNPMYSSRSDEKIQAERSERFAKKQLDQLRNEDSSYSNSEFYPFRYLASEGFLPGYNFTKLPIRVAINGYKTAEYLSRPRLIAISEYGPKNIIYHNGQSYEIKRISSDNIEKNLNQTKAKISKTSGYLLMGDEYSRETCPISNINLSGQDDYILDNLLEMTESIAEQRQRITSEEEERMRLGYDLQTYFSLPKGTEGNELIKIKYENEKLLDVYFMPTTKIILVNKKWNRSKRDYFLIDKQFGYWKKEIDAEKDEENKILSCSLFTDYLADALYIQPVQSLGLSKDQIITLQFALRRAIEEYFQIEPSEIAVTLMGESDTPNILIYEATEGSLGILSQFSKDEAVFNDVIKKAYELCHFKEGKDTEPDIGPASYKDLLNYYNQRYHEVIDRHQIRDILEKLSNCTIEISSNAIGDYESHYQNLLVNYDKSSSTELRFLNYLYKNGLRLPDKAQPKLKEDYGLYVMPDFQYGKNTFVFCDGSPHDEREVIQKDKQQRKAMRKAGLRIIAYHYMENIEDIIGKNKDVFIKVK